MANWALTPGLTNLRNQVNVRFPLRDKKSDGTIGDTAHQNESSSDHNPDDTPGSRPGWEDADHQPDVRAWDMDSDLNDPEVSCQELVDHVRHLPGVSAVLRYIIYNRIIYEASNGWAGRPYTGPSAHTEHAHFSGQRTEAADQNKDFNYKLEELGTVAITAAEIDAIADRVLVNLRNSLDDLSDSERNRLTAVVDAKLAPRFAAIGAAVTALAAKQADPAALAAAVAKAVVASLPEDRDDVTVEELTESLKVILRGGVDN